MRFIVRGARIVPGFVDLQINGCYGIDFSNATVDEILEAARRLPELGTTAFCPTIISSEPHATLRAIRNVRDAMKAQTRGALILGAHLEGPWISPEWKGVHPSGALRRPSRRELRAWLAIGGVRIITLAPELPGALEVIRAASRRGVLVSLGHTGADGATARAAIAAGARLVTHLFNGMRPLHHREETLLNVALNDDRLACGFIYDRFHVEPGAARVALRCKPPGKLFLVSDAMPILGRRDGEFTCAGLRLVARKGRVVEKKSGRLGGGGLSLLEIARLAREDLGPRELCLRSGRIALDDRGVCRAAWIDGRLAYADPNFVECAP